MMRTWMVAAALTAAGMVAPATAQVVTVSVAGGANPFLAGQPAGATCCSGDVAPGQSPAAVPLGFTGGDVIAFGALGGTSNVGGAPINGPDGDELFDMVADYGTGIAGPLQVRLNGLVGVFLGAGVPGAAPAALDFSGGLDFLILMPQIGQIFWIGDGLSGTQSGIVQQFVAPVGATRLFLGSSDGFGWANNSGAFLVDAYLANQAVPEPASWAMLVLGAAGVGGLLRQRPKRVLA